MTLTGPDDELSPGWLAHASGRLIMNRTGGFHPVSRIVKARTPIQAPNESLIAVYLSYLDRLVLTTQPQFPSTAPILSQSFAPQPVEIPLSSAPQ